VLATLLENMRLEAIHLPNPVCALNGRCFHWAVTDTLVKSNLVLEFCNISYCVESSFMNLFTQKIH
jgi:hypothetical protein